MTHLIKQHRSIPLKLTVLSALAVLTLLAIALAAPKDAAAQCASTSSGGLNMSSDTCKPVKRAKLVNGKAIAPASAPRAVKKVIRAANKIRNKPYKWGGGHGSWKDSGYDCSGSVSYALRGGKLISSPMASGGYMGWERRGKGKWITVYAHSGHMYMVVAGLRFDTSMTPGNGPGWSKSLRSNPGQSFKVRHPAGL